MLTVRFYIYCNFLRSLLKKSIWLVLICKLVQGVVNIDLWFNFHHILIRNFFRNVGMRVLTKWMTLNTHGQTSICLCHPSTVQLGKTIIWISLTHLSKTVSYPLIHLIILILLIRNKYCKKKTCGCLNSHKVLFARIIS